MVVLHHVVALLLRLEEGAHRDFGRAVPLDQGDGGDEGVRIVRQNSPSFCDREARLVIADPT